MSVLFTAAFPGPGKQHSLYKCLLKQLAGMVSGDNLDSILFYKERTLFENFLWHIQKTGLNSGLETTKLADLSSFSFDPFWS